jgi:hypothetical protein
MTDNAQLVSLGTNVPEFYRGPYPNIYEIYLVVGAFPFCKHWWDSPISFRSRGLSRKPRDRGDLMTSMTLHDVQILAFEKLNRGVFGDVEFSGFLCGKIENPLQVILTDRQTRISRIVDIDRDDGSIVTKTLFQPSTQDAASADA